jgi:hypothetical protein
MHNDTSTCVGRPYCVAKIGLEQQVLLLVHLGGRNDVRKIGIGSCMLDLDGDGGPCQLDYTDQQLEAIASHHSHRVNNPRNIAVLFVAIFQQISHTFYEFDRRQLDIDAAKVKSLVVFDI